MKRRTACIALVVCILVLVGCVSKQGLSAEEALMRALELMPAATAVVSAEVGLLSRYTTVLPEGEVDRMVWAVTLSGVWEGGCPFTRPRRPCFNQQHTALVILDFVTGDQVLIKLR